MLKAPGTKRLKVQCDEPVSSFAFKFNLRHYSMMAMLTYRAPAAIDAKFHRAGGLLMRTSTRPTLSLLTLPRTSV